MRKYFACLMGLVLCSSSFAQGAFKKAVSGASRRVHPKVYTLKDLRLEKAKKAVQHRQARKWRALTGRPFVVDPVVPPAFFNRTSYELNIEDLFSEKDLEVINNNAYFDEVFLPLHAQASALERYFIARNNRVNTLEKLAWRSRLDYLRKNSWKIAQNLDVSLSYGVINYLDYIPKDVKILYLGEAHYSSKIKKEVINVLEQLRAARPQQPIFLLTEFLPDTYYLLADMRMPKWLSKSYGAAVWKRANELGIHIVGVENQRLVNNLSREDFYKRYDARMDGTARRNAAWLYHVRELQKNMPDALIVVYAGGAHVDASFYHNLPALVGEKKSYIIDFDLPDMKPAFKPIFNYMKLPEKMEADFGKDKHAKMLTCLLDESYKKLIGFDLSVTVHLVPGEMPKGLAHEK